MFARGASYNYVLGSVRTLSKTSEARQQTSQRDGRTLLESNVGISWNPWNPQSHEVGGRVHVMLQMSPTGCNLFQGIIVMLPQVRSYDLKCAVRRWLCAPTFYSVASRRCCQDWHSYAVAGKRDVCGSGHWASRASLPNVVDSARRGPRWGNKVKTRSHECQCKILNTADLQGRSEPAQVVPHQ
jgi:hypothetical protein